jgi:bacteriocin biosynthesis cyclodehydratase domain-containing protein
VNPPAAIGFRRDLAAQVVPGEALYLHGEHELTAVRGSDVELLAPLLTGTLPLSDIVAAATEAGRRPERTAAVLRSLVEARLLSAHAASPAPDHELAWWEGAGRPAEDAADHCRGRSVEILDLTVASAGHVTDALASAVGELDGDVRSVADRAALSGADLTVVLTDDYLDARLAPLAAQLRADGRAWLPARPHGATLWIGPFFDDPAGACLCCLTDQLSVQRLATLQLRRDMGSPVLPPRATLAPLERLAGSTLALEITKWLGGHRSAGQRAIWTLDSVSLATRHHVVRRRPQCPTCGDPDLMRRRSARPVVLSTRATHAGCPNRDRARDPEATYAQYEHLIGPVTGVLPDVLADSRAPDAFAVMRSGGNHAVRTGDMDAIRSGLRAENGGKGATLAQARTSALCEALERHSASFAGDEAIRWARVQDVGAEAVHPEALQLWSADQYRHRDNWNSTHGAFQQVPPPLDDGEVLAWTPAWSLSHQAPRLLPTGLVYLGAPAPVAHPALRADSNGCAAGTSVEDAVLHGLLEVIERDAVALWWYNRLAVPEMPLHRADPWTRKVLQAHADHDREVWALDLTSDFGVPVVAAVSRRHTSPEEIIFGFGAHLDPRLATVRALAELNQLMPPLLTQRSGPPAAGERGDVDAERWWAQGSIAEDPYVSPDPAAARIPPRTSGPSGDLSQDVQTVVQLLAGQGLETIVADLTRPDIGLPVARVVVPGLRGFWARHAPGRLYDLPVELGRRVSPLREDEMNPIPMFL